MTVKDSHSMPSFEHLNHENYYKPYCHATSSYFRF